MSGCFGNAPYDRYVEGQLYRYLDQCQEDENSIEFAELEEIHEKHYYDDDDNRADCQCDDCKRYRDLKEKRDKAEREAAMEDEYEDAEE